MIPADYLDRVADLVEERGWEKFATDQRDKVAVLQAMKLIEPVDWWLVEQVLRHRIGAEVRWPAIGNTQAEVVDFLRSSPPISDDDLAQVFGASWRHMVAITRRFSELTKEETDQLGAWYWDRWHEAFPDPEGKPDPANAWFARLESAYIGAQKVWYKRAGYGRYRWPGFPVPPYPSGGGAYPVLKDVSIAILATDETTPPGAYDPLLEAWRRVIDPNFMREATRLRRRNPGPDATHPRHTRRSAPRMVWESLGTSD